MAERELLSGLDMLPKGELVARRFVIERLAAHGGMSVVYRGSDLETGSAVAIKVIRTRDSHSDERFASEVDILSALSHPSIVRYIAHGETRQGARFLAMEWLSGEDLGSRLARSGLRISEGLALVRQLCAGLSAAHERGVLHRDIKPSNVFLVGESVDSVKLLDFGVARRDSARSTLTKTGAFIGTVGYMAPEQARGALDLDARTDVFSLGCLLFECLTGRPAFSGSHDLAVLAKVLRDEPPRVSALRPELGTEFDGLMTQLLAKDRSDRPASARAALREVEATYARSASRNDAAPVAQERTSYAEQRISSVVLGQPRRLEGAVTQPARSHPELMQALSSEFGAEVVPMQGGAVLLLLRAGANTTATDQAARAARCVLCLAEKRPELSLALATGAIDTSAHVPVGLAIDRAAALLDEDAPSIKLDVLTASLLGTRFEFRRTSRGLSLEREREDSESSDVLMGKSTPFVGRAKELSILHASLRECIDEEAARAVLVMGAAGAGKSRLGREFLERIRVEGSARVLYARADPTTAGSSLSLIQKLIRNAAGLRAGAPLDVQRALLASYLRTTTQCEHPDDRKLDFVSEILGVAALQPERPLQLAARSDPEVMREQKRRAFELWMSAEVAAGPLILFLEDLHWGDFPSITYVQEVLRSLAKRPLFVLATSRPELHTQFPRLHDGSEFEELSLRGLTKRASEQLARTMLPPDTSDSVISKVVALAGGNAFYLEELVRRVAEGGGTELPETVVAMAQSRIERLPTEARRVLRAASVFGETAWAEGVDRLLSTSFENDALLGWLVEQEILLARVDTRFPGECEYVFRHALLREAAYAMLTDGDRQSGHLRAGEWLEQRGERDARVLADHFERGGAIARAVPWIAKAAMAALDGGDFESAIALSRRGTGLGAYGEERGRLLLVHAYASTWKCDPELPGEALSLLPRASAPWWLALSLHVFGSSLLGTPELAEPYLQLALTTSPDTELTGAYGQAIQVLAAGTALVGRANIGWSLVRHFEQASKSHRSQSDPAFLAWFNLSKCILASNSLSEDGRWDLGCALTWGHASIEAMRVLGSGSGEAAALFHLANTCWQVGSFSESRTLLQHAVKLAKQTGNLLVAEHSTLLLSVAAMREGQRAEALATLRELAASANLQISHAAATVLADCDCRDGNFDEAIPRAEQAASGCSLLYRRTARGTLARAHLGRARYREALQATSHAFEDGGTSVFPHLTVDLLSSRARALLGSGDRRGAEGTVLEASRFRADTARTIEDQAIRHAFVRRGRANRILDELASELFGLETEA